MAIIQLQDHDLNPIKIQTQTQTKVEVAVTFNTVKDKSATVASLSKGRMVVDLSSGITLDPPVKFKVPYSFCKIDKGTTFKLRYIVERWHWFNTELFGGQMKVPNIQVDKAFKNPKTLGFWRGSDRVLMMAHKMFTLPTDKQILGTLVHEMAHQYDFEILQTPWRERMIKRGHGPSWDHVMQSVGMPADDKFAGDADELLDEKQKENLDLRRGIKDPNDPGKSGTGSNKITVESLDGLEYLPALYINGRGDSTPIILLNKQMGGPGSGDLYRGFDKSDVKKDSWSYYRLANCIKPTTMQMKKFPVEFKSVRALELIQRGITW